MKIELLVVGITVFFIADTYYNGKYIAILKSWKKYYRMAIYAFFGISFYILLKKKPMESRSLLHHANGIIKYMPIDKEASDLLTPFFNDFKPQEKRMMNSGNQFNGNINGNINGNGNGNVKRSVSETKKKYIASKQNWKCGQCNEQLTAWFEVDHMQRLDQGGSNHVDNLVALCRNCHGEKTAMENL